MRIRSQRLWLTALLVLVPALGACNRDAEPEVQATPPAMETVTDQLAVTGVDLGNAIGADMRITDPSTVDEFRPADTIYASVATTGTASGATLTARWTYQDGQLVDETSQTVSPSAPAVTEFHIAKPDGFPAGGYKVEILLNGASVQSKDFVVK